MSGFIDAIGAAPGISVSELLGDRPLVVLAPHPDDETLACGALLFDAAARGVPCTVICVTDGSRSHPNAREGLAELRRSELGAAMTILAPGARIHWLGHSDCEIPEDVDITNIIPHGALVLASWNGDPHIDHENTARLARQTADARPDIALAFYPVWGRFTDLTAEVRLLDASDAAKQAKRRALACHRSQMTHLIDDPDGFVMQEWQQDHFLSHAEIVIAP